MRVFLTGLLLALLASPAYAVTIKNLSDSTQVVVIEQGGNQQEVILPAGATRHYVGGAVKLIMPGQRPVNADFHDEYAIWPSGKMHIQRRHKAKGTSR